MLRKVKRVKKIKKRRLKTKKDIKSSKIERAFGLFLKNLGFEIETQFELAYKFYDFKIKGKDIIIEFDGDYWHTNPSKFPNGPIDKVQLDGIQNDAYKNALAAASGFKLIRIWEDDFRKRKELVKEKLLKEIK